MLLFWLKWSEIKIKLLKSFRNFLMVKSKLWYKTHFLICQLSVKLCWLFNALFMSTYFICSFDLCKKFENLYFACLYGTFMSIWSLILLWFGKVFKSFPVLVEKSLTLSKLGIFGEENTQKRFLFMEKVHGHIFALWPL